MATFIPAQSATTLALALSIDEQRRTLSLAAMLCRDKLKAKSVHALRTAVRRLRAALELAETLGYAVNPRVARRLGELMAALSPLRDVQVQLRTLEDTATSPGHATLLIAQLRRKKRRLKRKAGRRLAAFRLASLERQVSKLTRRLEAAASQKDEALAVAVVLQGELARRHLLVLQHRARVAEDEPRSLHELRLALKSYRYGMATLVAVLPSRTQELMQVVSRLQDELGSAQDAHVLAETASACARRSRSRDVEELAFALDQASRTAQRSGVDAARSANFELPFAER